MSENNKSSSGGLWENIKVLIQALLLALLLASFQSRDSHASNDMKISSGGVGGAEVPMFGGTAFSLMMWIYDHS